MLDILIGAPGYLFGLVGAGVVEGIGIPWPGALYVATTGFVESSWTQMALLATVFSVGYTLGALAQYFIGCYLGQAALAWLPGDKRERLQSLLARFGPATVLWSRPLAIGNYVSIPAGMMRMPLGQFLLYTWLGAWPWALGLVVAGRLLGSQFSVAVGAVSQYLLPATIALCGVSLLAVAWRRLRRVPGV